MCTAHENFAHGHKFVMSALAVQFAKGVCRLVITSPPSGVLLDEWCLNLERVNVRSVRDARNRQDRHLLTGPGRAFVFGIDRYPLAVHIFSTMLRSIRAETTGGLGMHVQSRVTKWEIPG